jgi:hypothetical protein
VKEWPNVRFEGGLVTPELLRSVAALKAPLQSPSDYQLDPGTRVVDEIRDQWERLRRAWASYQPHRATPERPDLKGGRREHWQQPLLRALGFHNLTDRPSLRIGSRDVPIARAWQVNEHTLVPIHLVGACVPLDRRTEGATGAAGERPHALLQGYLNDEPRALWGIVGDGLVLRILRDTTSLARPPFVEFDVAAIFDGNDFAGFTLLWLVAHSSRFAGERPAECALERWSQESARQGTRALDGLREGVQRAIEALGIGLVSHPRNEELRAALRSGALARDELLREVLRLVYRILFVAVAEERDVLLDPQRTPGQSRLYGQGYSLRRLFRLSDELHGTDHGDLWHSLGFVFERLHSGGAPELGLVPLGSFLFAPRSTPHLLPPGTHPASDSPAWRVELRNRDLLCALRALVRVVDPDTKVVRRVDFSTIGAEELGSVYESLLELHLDSATAPDQFRLAIAAGNERKSSGSYYTPDSLVQCLLDSALEPVVAAALAGKPPRAAEESLLALKVLDPACGSGHFLVAAAHRLARHLARVRAGTSEPTPEEHRSALRDVVRRSIYGVDINPMAAELCKIALWVESMEPGRPLSFLDHHVQVGNALVGATPALLKGGIPEGAFEELEGDDKAVLGRLKKLHKSELKDRGRKQSAFDFEQAAPLVVPAGFQKLSLGDDDTVSAVETRAKTFAALQADPRFQHARLVHDAWCAAFFWKKDGTKVAGHEGITESVLRDLERHPERHPLGSPLREHIAALAREHAFLHLHLAFPEAFDANGGGGFDCILGNPPWERVKLQEKEWFAQRIPEIANAPNAAARTRLIKALVDSEPSLHAAFLSDVRAAEAASAFLRSSGRYPLCGRGDVNLYTVFTEAMRDSVSPSGRVGCIVPSGIATDDTTKFFFQDIVGRASLVSLFDFENAAPLFEGVHRSYKFSCITLRAPAADEKVAAKAAPAEFVFFAHRVEHLADEQRRFTLTRDEIALVNPNTKTCPIFRTKVDAELTKHIYRRVPVLVDENKPDGNPWGVQFSTMFHMSNDSGLFRTREQLEQDSWKLRGNVFVRGTERYLPLYEAKLVHHFDHRWATYEGTETRDTTEAERADASRVSLPRYWVPAVDLRSRLKTASAPEWMVAYRWITNTTNERTFVATATPEAAFGNSAPVVYLSPSPDVNKLLWCSIGCSLVFDYCARQKLGGVNMTFGTTEQLPFITPEQLTAGSVRGAGGTLLARAVELSATADDMFPFSKDLWPEGDGAVFRYDPERRFEIRCELDAAFFHLYLGTPEEWSRTASPELLKSLPTPRDSVAYIMETFPIVKRKDEEAHGHYRTKERILALYDELQRCLASGQPFKSTLNPPPGPPTNPDGTFAKLPAWPKGAPQPPNWPAHLHPPASHRPTP